MTPHHFLPMVAFWLVYFGSDFFFFGEVDLHSYEEFFFGLFPLQSLGQDTPGNSLEESVLHWKNFAAVSFWKSSFGWQWVHPTLNTDFDGNMHNCPNFKNMNLIQGTKILLIVD